MSALAYQDDKTGLDIFTDHKLLIILLSLSA